MQFKVMGWVLVVVSAFFAVVGAAPFGGGVFFPLISLPVAAVVAWRGPVVAPLLVVGLAVLGFFISVIPRDTLLRESGFIAWAVGWTVALAVGVLRQLTRGDGHRDD
ncbi:hypothetical protein PDM28_10275 [Stenotrophomonas aracearum]|jgi:hypothetical protein|uniref:Transmembrane protein n=1 Tax=Stenotrophomonas aracearum TaxID=3003272 RepID=A0ABY9Y8A8_9GAMM|nr:hypothetical protein [Stenotrophomonas sp. A5588]WNH47097.1 hypothetical protein PDM28_10275 [Stenotrophomonas sp. A5588]